MKAWRDAASVMLFAQNALVNGKKSLVKNSSKFEYQMLMLRRSGKSKFMPNAYVFPGGVCSEADFDRRWIDLFQKFGEKDYADLVSNDGKPRPLLMKSQSEDQIPRDIAFR